MSNSNVARDGTVKLDSDRRGTMALLGDPNFLRVWLIGLCSGTIRWLETLAVGVFVFERTGDAFIVALVLFLRMMPMLLFGALIGVVADRISRKKLLIAGMVMLCANSIAMGTLAYVGPIAIWQLAIGSFISGLVWSMDFPVRRTVMGEIAGMRRAGFAMGLDTATSNATRMIGPILGGLLLQFLDIKGVYFVGTLMFVIAIILAVPVRYQQNLLTSSTSGFLRNLMDGFHYIRSQRIITGVLVVTLLLNLLGFPFVSMLPVIGRDELGLTPVSTGFLASAEGLGALIATLLIVACARPDHYIRVFICGALLFLTSIMLFSLSGNFYLSLALVFVGGTGVAGFAVMQSTLMIISAPPEMRARVMGALAVCIGTGPIGVLLVGALATMFGAPMAVSLISSTGLILTALVVFMWPELRLRTRVL